MNEQEIKDWLNVGDSVLPLRPEITEGMKDVPAPGDQASQMNVFRAFLACGVRPEEGIFDKSPRWLTLTDVEEWCAEQRRAGACDDTPVRGRLSRNDLLTALTVTEA